MFLTVGKRTIPSRILKVYGLDGIYEVSSSTFCVKNCGKTFGTVRFSGAGAGCGLPVRVRFTCGQNLARTPGSVFFIKFDDFVCFITPEKNRTKIIQNEMIMFCHKCMSLRNFDNFLR